MFFWNSLVSPLLPCKCILQYHFSRFYRYVLEYSIYLSLSDLTSPCISSRFIHRVRTDSDVFLLWLSNIPLCTCTTISLSNRQWTSKLLLCPSYCKATMNIGVHDSFSIMVSWRYMPCGIVGSYGSFFP